MVTAGILPFRENSHERTGNRTRDLMISSQRLWPLDHEAGHAQMIGPYKLKWRWATGRALQKQEIWSSQHTTSALRRKLKTLNLINRLKFKYFDRRNYAQSARVQRR